MSEPRGPLRVDRVRSSYVRADGTTKSHESVLLRRTWREGKSVKKHTVTSLTSLPADEVLALEAVLNHGARPQHPNQGKTSVTLGAGFTHGNIAAVLAVMNKIGLPDMLGEPSRQRNLIIGLIVARLCHPASKISQATWWDQTTLAQDYELNNVARDEPYRAMDWLAARQTQIETALAKQYLTDPTANPAQLVLYDLTSTWVEGTKCELASFGHSRDGKKGLKQIEFGIIAAPSGIPVGVRVFPGNTADPQACKAAITTIQDQYHMADAILVGDRGMVTGTRIAELRQDRRIGWIGALRHDAITRLATNDGPLQMSLFEETDLFHFTDPEYPDEVLIACRNPHRAEHQQAKRERLIQATLTDLDKIARRIERRTLIQPTAIERAIGKIIDKHKVAKLINVQVSRGRIAYGRNTTAINAETTTDGVYVIRTSIPTDRLPPTQIVNTYKQLKNVEKDFAWLKSTDISVRPIRHWTNQRVTAHLLICQLAALIEWHLRDTLKPLTFTDEQPPTQTTPSTPAKRSPSATTKATTRTNTNGQPLWKYRELIDHLGTLTRHTITITTPTTTQQTTELTHPTPTQTQAFQLLHTPIPKTLPR